MTRAVCIHCGANKIGALTPCVACGRDVTSPAQHAQSLLLSDHHMTAEALDTAAAQIRAGEKPALDPTALAQLAAAFSDPEVQRILEPSRWERFKMTMFIMGFLAVFMGILGFIGWLLFWVVGRLF